MLLGAILSTSCSVKLGCDMPEGCHRPVSGQPGTCEAEPAERTDDCVCPEGLIRYWDCERFAPVVDAGEADGGPGDAGS